jgi:hypothetical protein
MSEKKTIKPENPEQAVKASDADRADDRTSSRANMRHNHRHNHRNNLRTSGRANR